MEAPDFPPSSERRKLFTTYIILYLVLVSVVPAPARRLQQSLTTKIYIAETAESGPLKDPPVSPYGKARDICPPARGGAYTVKNYPGTPYTAKPFTNQYTQPQEATPVFTECRAPEDPAATEPAARHCMVAFNMSIKSFQARPWDTTLPDCIKQPPTTLLGYNSTSPGPTIVIPVGHEAMVRFNNEIDDPVYPGGQPPCAMRGGGRPVSIHLHGSESLSPFDGWADDVTCTGESKDYVYPNNRAGTGWYHDHGIHVTAGNAYAGLAGFYLASGKVQHGGCGEPYDLEGMEERLFMLSDAVLDRKCQKLFAPEKGGVHEISLFGDINLVNGVPWPYMNLDAKWYRFRMLNAATSRPWMLRIKESVTGADVHHTICKVIAGDGGYRDAAVDLGAEGLQMGVAERYELVCDFSNLAGKTLYLWNGWNKAMMPDVPYFCYSHLVAKFIVVAPPNTPPAVFNATKLPGRGLMDKVLSDTDIAAARALIAADQPHRRMEFGRRNGIWVINGETWDSFKIAAEDVGHNTWELWHLKTGGGWFHPVHMHLVDFFVLERNRNSGDDLFAFERMTPKDVVYLGPGQDIYLIARFGAHRGSYMFHCHNLIHEDDDMLRAFRVVGGMNMDGVAAKNGGPSTTLSIHEVAGVIYNNYQYNDPMDGESSATPTKDRTELSQELVKKRLDLNVYRIFYPNSTDLPDLRSDNNPWFSKTCKLLSA